MSNGNKQALGHETAVIEDWLLLRTSSIGKKKWALFVGGGAESTSASTQFSAPIFLFGPVGLKQKKYVVKCHSQSAIDFIKQECKISL